MRRRKGSEQPYAGALHRGGRRALVPAPAGDRARPAWPRLRLPSRPRHSSATPTAALWPTARPRGSCNTLRPAICLLAGIGAAALLSLFRFPRLRTSGPAPHSGHPRGYRDRPPGGGRLSPLPRDPCPTGAQFARRFWPEFARDAEPVCLRWDLGLREWDSANLNVAVYLCNQMIYSPQRQQQGNPSRRQSQRAGPFAACCPWPTRPTAGLPAGSTP